MRFSTKDDLLDCRIEKDGEDVWWVDGQEKHRVGSFVYCFPETSPATWLSVRGADGVELALIRSLDHMNASSRAVVSPILHEKYYIPVITRLLSVDTSVEGKHIRVQTTDGQDALDIRGEADVDLSHYPRVQLIDRGRNRKYVIEDIPSLDKESRDLARRFLPASRGGRSRRFR